jgi:hypothetical protein
VPPRLSLKARRFFARTVVATIAADRRWPGEALERRAVFVCVERHASKRHASKQQRTDPMRKTMLALAALLAVGATTVATSASAAPSDHRMQSHWRGDAWRGGGYWGTFNDVYPGPYGYRAGTRYRCGGGAYVSCAPSW